MEFSPLCREQTDTSVTLRVESRGQRKVYLEGANTSTVSLEINFERGLEVGFERGSLEIDFEKSSR